MDHLVGILDRLARFDVLLRAIDDPHVAQTQRVHLALQHINCIRATVHQVQLGQDPKGALSCGENGVKGEGGRARAK